MSNEIALLRREIRDLRDLILERLPVRRRQAPDLYNMDHVADRVAISMKKRLAEQGGKENA
jgi:hypothetical protein